MNQDASRTRREYVVTYGMNLDKRFSTHSLQLAVAMSWKLDEDGMLWSLFEDGLLLDTSEGSVVY